VVIAGSPPLVVGPGDTAAISVITIGELRAGVRLAAHAEIQAARQARLAAVRQAFEPIPVDESVAEQYGEILAAARAQRRTTKATDLLIVATAAATGRTLLTLDDTQRRLADAVGVSARD
jgi:toxin FitB